MLLNNNKKKEWTTDTYDVMNLRNIMLNLRGQTQQSIYYMVLLLWHSSKGKFNLYWKLSEQRLPLGGRITGKGAETTFQYVENIICLNRNVGCMGSCIHQSSQGMIHLRSVHFIICKIYFKYKQYELTRRSLLYTMILN